MRWYSFRFWISAITKKKKKKKKRNTYQTKQKYVKLHFIQVYQYFYTLIKTLFPH